MAFDYYELKEVDTLTASPSGIVVNGGAETVYIRLILLHNTDTVSRNIKFWTVPNGNSPVDGNKWFDEDMTANETLEFNFGAPGIILTTSGDALYAQAAVADAVTIQIYGGKDI